MSWKWLPERFRSLAFRLGISCALIFGLDAVTRAVRRVADGDFRERVVLTGAGEEMVRPGKTYNRMADRIETLVRKIQRALSIIAQPYHLLMLG